MGNVFGRLFRIMTWGESHGPAVGVTIDGCPSGIPFDLEKVQHALDRRRPGQSSITTPRKEADCVEVLSGVFEGKTTGTPISLVVKNKDHNSKAYDHLKDVFRPSHADYTFQEKFGVRDYRGGGRSSARETIGRVAAGAVAQQVLEAWGVLDVIGYVSQVHTLKATVDHKTVSMADVDATVVRCPDLDTAEKMIALIEQTRKDGDSVGGVVSCVIRGLQTGLGEPVFDKLKSELAKAMMSIPATMGFQIGSGFTAPDYFGSQHNDAFYVADDVVRTRTNRSGGIQGGISNGETVYFDVAFKPTATIFKEQETVTTDLKPTTLQAKGRHDPCVLPRAVPIVEAMAYLVVLDQLMLYNSRNA